MKSSHGKVTCPSCKKETVLGVQNPYRPFCSRQCQLVDLGDWLDEFGYRDDNIDPNVRKTDEFR